MADFDVACHLNILGVPKPFVSVNLFTSSEMWNLARRQFNERIPSSI
jgi:hypothetical protein